MHKCYFLSFHFVLFFDLKAKANLSMSFEYFPKNFQ